jgi:hypothetical protein
MREKIGSEMEQNYQKGDKSDVINSARDNTEKQ